MIEVAAVAYGMIASFVMSSVARNRKAARRDPPILVLFGWLLMAFSAATGLLLLGYAGLRVTGVAIA